MKNAESQAAGGRSLVVSLHDVSPRTRPIFERMLAELKSLGVRQCSLLVIPDHHHQGHMLADAGFCRWLERLAKEGHELVAHGYYHQRATRATETWTERMMTRVYTKGEGEFYDLSKDAAATLLARAKRDFAQLDAPPPAGFIAPAWLLSTAADEAVREAGFRYTTLLTGVKDYRGSGDGFIAARSLVYSPRNLWRRTCSLGYVAMLARWLRQAPLLRLSLHPPDHQHANLWRQVRRIVVRALATRNAITYEDYVTSRQPAAGAATGMNPPTVSLVNRRAR